MDSQGNTIDPSGEMVAGMWNHLSSSELAKVWNAARAARDVVAAC